MEYCEKYEALISAAVDGELPEQEQRELMDHLAQCPACREVYSQMMAMSLAFDELEAEVPGDLTADVMNQIRTQSAARPARRRWLQIGAAAACCALVLWGAQGLNRTGNSGGGAADDASAYAVTASDTGAEADGCAYSANMEKKSLDRAAVDDEQMLEDVLTYFCSGNQTAGVFYDGDGGAPAGAGAIAVPLLSSSDPGLMDWMVQNASAVSYTDAGATAWLISAEECQTLEAYLAEEKIDYILEDGEQAQDPETEEAEEGEVVCVIYLEAAQEP